MKTTNKLSKWCKRTLMLLPAVAILTLVACDKEDTPNPFEGADNHITSFVLTKGDVSYTAAIAAGTITVTVPENVSLNGATAEVALCENATINPKPADISDWDSEQQFVVTAYNGTKTTYTYTVEHSGIIHTGAVILNTQAEVDAFGQGEYTVIDGYLTIGRTSGADTITSLTPLAGLKTVTGSIVVNTTYGGEDLTVFEQLETVGELHVLSKKVRTVRFPKLVAVRTNVNFDQATAIETLDFPDLTVIEKSLRIYYADSLATVNFPKLERVLENVTIEGGAAAGTHLQAINFPKLTAAGGTIKVSSNPGVESFSASKLETAGGVDISSNNVITNINLPALTSVSGALTINNSSAPIIAINLPALTSVNSNLTLTSSTTTTNLQLPALTTVKGTLSLTLPGLTSLDGLSSLKEAGTFTAVDLRSITAIDVRGMEIGTLSFGSNTLMYTTGITVTGDESFAGRLYCYFPNLLQAPVSTPDFPITVQGIEKVGGLELVGPISGFRIQLTEIEFDWLKEVDGLLSISGWNFVEDISLPNLKRAGGLTITSDLALKTLDLSSLEEITGYTNASGVAAGGFTYTVSSSSITSLVLPELQSVEGNLSITGLTSARQLATIEFPELETITGTLTITGTSNTKFTSLNGFSKLELATGVTISGFTQLSDFSPLGKVVCSLPNTAAWKITSCGGTPANYSYETMKSTYCDND